MPMIMSLMHWHDVCNKSLLPFIKDYLFHIYGVSCFDFFLRRNCLKQSSLVGTGLSILGNRVKTSTDVNV